MSLFNKRNGYFTVKIISAEPLTILQNLADNGLVLFNVNQIDSLTITARLSIKERKNICSFLDSKGCAYSVINGGVAQYSLRSIAKRGIITFGIILILLATVLLPTRIFFVKVAGNQFLSDKYIIFQAEKCGITFGVSRKHIRSESIKNDLLQRIPELQWAGINTSGCVATIHVREKNMTPPNEESVSIGNIVAERDGVIYNCIVEKGFPRCHVGQAVKKGQVLVSAYQDMGIAMVSGSVKADVFALTERSLFALSPCNYLKRTYYTSEFCRYSVRFGKKIINLYKDSGIYDSTCVKMYEEDYLSLPGGFRLPVAIIKERIIYNDVVCGRKNDPHDFEWLSTYVDAYILHQMIAGQILYKNSNAKLLDNVYTQYVDYACIELIGKKLTEETVKSYGKNY